MPKTEPDSNVLTPVAYIDCIEMGDSKNNCMTTDHMKTYLGDNTFIEDSPLSIPSSSTLLNGYESIIDPFEPINAEEMNRASASLGLQGPYQWSHAVSTPTHFSPDTNWLLTPEAQVPNLLDPVYTYDQEPAGTETNLQYYSSETDGVSNTDMVSSDFISSTYSNGDHSTSDLGLDSDLSAPIAWHKQAHPIHPMFSNYSALVDEFGNLTNMPNVEELTNTQIEFIEDPGTVTFYTEDQTQRKRLEMVSERNVSSTTLGTKWTYATPNSNEQPKPAERPKNQLPRTEPGHSTPSSTLSQGEISETSVTTNCCSSGGLDMSSLPNSSNNSGATSRKERPVHYCTSCNKGFKEKYSVNVHNRTHTGEKPFACTLCEKTFRQKAHMAKHYQTHVAKANGKTRKRRMKKTMAEV